MFRIITEDLVKWKKSKDRKPLLIYGARQVGKTWIMKEFAKTNYIQSLYLNFDDDPKLKEYFEVDLLVERIITSLEFVFKIKITTDTLLIFDEIQECPRAITSLKYFCENAPKYHVMAAGSFLGVTNLTGSGFPVGKVDMLTMYPLTFYEFLQALNEDQLLEAINNLNFPLIKGLSSRYLELLQTYFCVGGMPEAIQSWVHYKDLNKVRDIQNGILDSYYASFAKHISNINISKVRMIWDSIPVHLSKEKKKFIFKELKEGGRASEFEDAISWLVQCGLVYKITNVSHPKLPLISYQKSSFKLYMLDVGLLTAKARLDISTFFTNTDLFLEFKGALTEQYVLQELMIANKNALFYWSRDPGTAEVDFIFQFKNEIIPLEVKAGKNKSKSLSVYLKEERPKLAIKTSKEDYRKNGNLFFIPLYMIKSIDKIIDQFNK